MFLRWARDRRFAFRLFLAWGVIASTWLFLRNFGAWGVRATQVPVRAFEWKLVPSDFESDEQGYLSPIKDAESPFTAAGVYVVPGASGAARFEIDLRLRTEGAKWSPWYPVDGLELEPNGRLYGENLVTWPRAQQIQVRIRFEGQAQRSPVQPTTLKEAITAVTVVAIDATAGPSTSEAVHAAQARTAQQASTLAGDAGVPRPVIISRDEWGANENWMTWSPEYVPVDKMIVHHTVSGGGVDPAAEVRAIYYYHAVTRGWGDVGYNYLVDRFGNLYEGRYGGPDVVGAHVSSWNEGSMGVSMLGCYDFGACAPSQIPTNDALRALTDLVAWTASRRGIDPRRLTDFYNGSVVRTNYALAGHRDYGSTVCPGGILYAELPGLRQEAWQQLPEYDVRFGWHDTPSILLEGQQVTVYPNLFNYGRLTWSDAEGVRLGYRWLKDGQVVAENSAAARIIPGAVVPFGEMTALVAQLTAPYIPGNLTLRWDMYQDGVGWFADQPPPQGRTSPLELVVEVKPTLQFDVRLSPSSVPAGSSVRVALTLEGPVGQPFEIHTSLPAHVAFVPGSGYSAFGIIQYETGQVTWMGTMDWNPAWARFDVAVSSELTAAIALSTTTTLGATGHSSLPAVRWFIVNGYDHYLPVTPRGWTN